VFPNGIKVTIWREEDQLLWQERGQNAVPGAFRIYPQSETNFFTTLDASQITFIKNDHGEVTAIKLHSLELPDLEGKKLKDK
jgi:hypothetical protein